MNGLTVIPKRIKFAVTDPSRIMPKNIRLTWNPPDGLDNVQVLCWIYSTDQQGLVELAQMPSSDYHNDFVDTLRAYPRTIDFRIAK